MYEAPALSAFFTSLTLRTVPAPTTTLLSALKRFITSSASGTEKVISTNLIPPSMQAAGSLIGVFRGFSADSYHQLMFLQLFYETLCVCHQVLLLSNDLQV